MNCLLDTFIMLFIALFVYATIKYLPYYIADWTAMSQYYLVQSYHE